MGCGGRGRNVWADVCRDYSGCSPLASLLLAAVFNAACAGGAAPPQVATGTITVRGTERIAWNQSSSDGQINQYTYVAYVDTARQPLPDASCQIGSNGRQAQCVSPLPYMQPGPHIFQLATVYRVFGFTLESPASASLHLLVTSASGSAVGPPVLERRVLSRTTTANGAVLSVQTLSTALTAPSAIAMLPDGTVLIAEAAGDLRVWHNGAILRDAPFHLADVAPGTDAGLIGMTLDPEFSSNHWIYLAYTVSQPDRGFTNRIVRVLEAHGALTEPVVLLEDAVPEAPLRTPRLRFGSDGKLYVAFPAGRDPSEAQNLATYAGKILRLNKDGTTPRDNAGYSPIVSVGHRAVAFDWAPSTKLMYQVERGWDGVDRLVAGSSSSPDVFSFDSMLDPTDAVVYATGAMTGFLGDLFIASLDGRHLRHVRFDPHEAGRVLSTERLVDGEFGRISAVTAGADGALYFCTANTTSGATSDQLVRIAAPPR